MAGPNNRKRQLGGRPFPDSKPQKRIRREVRERRVQKEYHSSSEDDDDEQQDFDAVNLLDSDDDIHNAKVDDIGDDDVSDASSSEDEASAEKQIGTAKGSAKLKAKMPAKKTAVDDNPDVEPLPEIGLDEESDDDDEEDEEDMNDEFDLGSDDEDGEGGSSKRVKKRNDPAAFATSLSKILSTKLSTSKRSDPVLARSAAAHETSKAVQDSALEAKAKRQMREQKRRAQEKGRVRDVLVATAAEVTPKDEVPAVTTADILAAEAKLRKVAQRGVVKMFNAVRAAQVKSGEAERATKQAGVIGMARREEKVNEMSKKGFLDLLASGGGGLKKGGIEEA